MKARHAVLILLALTAIAGGAEPRFAGTWKTSFGTLRLTEVGDTVEGTYMSSGRLCALAGQAKDRKLTFTYREPSATGEGSFDLAADGKSLAGKWRVTGTKPWGVWTGRRVETRLAAPPRFDGVWASSFGRMRLVQTGKKVHGYYAYADGSSITGTVEGRRMTFTYTEPATSGSARFDLSDDGQALHGKWKAKGRTTWKNWHALRVHPQPGLVWLVVIEAPWERTLQQPEYSFGQMLKSFFARTPHVQVRQRFFNNEAGFRKWCREVSYLAEPVVLSIATHGTPQGITVGGRTIKPEAISDGLRYASNLKLLHFSSCLIMKGGLAERMIKRQQGYARFPISGYSTPVDWAGSAVLEFLYYDLILSRRMPPAKAAEQIRRMLPFAGTKDVPGAAIKSMGFRILLPN